MRDFSNSRQQACIVIAVVLLFTIFFVTQLSADLRVPLFVPRTPIDVLRNNTQEAITRGCRDCEQLSTNKLQIMAQQIQDMYRPIVAQKANDWAPLGKDFCIADIDTRRYDHDSQILSENFTWHDTDALSSGMFNHYFYAAIHGYSYHMIQSEPWPHHDRDDVWTRLPQVLKLLDKCRIVLVVDGDVVFQQLQLPFEALLERWNFTNKTALAMPWDTDGLVYPDHPNWKQDPNVDEQGNLNINAGVMLAQDLPRTREILKTWITCPEEIEDCDKYRHEWPAEQGAFANHIRYMFQDEDDFRPIPCDDANGFPDQPSACNGVYLRHFTTSKSSVKENAGEVLLTALSSVFVTHQEHADKLVDG